MMTSLQECYFRCSRPPDVDGIKTFDKDEHVAKHCSFIILMFCDLQLVIFIKKFDPINIKRSRALEISVLQWGHHEQSYYTYQKHEALAAHLISFSKSRPLVLGHSFLYLRCLCLDLTSFYKIVYPSYEKIKCSQLLNHCSLLHQFYSDLEILYSGKLLKVYIVSGKSFKAIASEI